MAFPAPPSVQQFGYTVPASSLAVAVLPGSWEWANASVMAQVFAAFDAGTGPSGASFIAKIRQNGTRIATITVVSGQVESLTSLSPRVRLAAGDLITFEITQTGSAAGPVTLGFTYL